MNRSQFLREVGDTLTKREHTYGHPSNNLRAIAKTWSEYRGQEFNYLDVCIMMILTKAMRLKQEEVNELTMKYDALSKEADIREANGETLDGDGSGHSEELQGATPGGPDDIDNVRLRHAGASSPFATRHVGPCVIHILPLSSLHTI